MTTQHAIELIEQFNYWDWEHYFNYKFKDNPYLCGMHMDHEHSYNNQDILKMYESMPENMDEFVMHHKRKEDYFFLGFSYDFCHLIQTKHEIYPLLKTQNYDAMYDRIKSNQDSFSSVRDILLSIIDYFFHYHIKNGEITQDDDDFFLDVYDLFEKKDTKILKQFIDEHTKSRFKLRDIEEVKMLTIKTHEFLSFTHDYIEEVDEIMLEMVNCQGKGYELLSYEQMILNIHHEKNHIEQLLQPITNDGSRVKRKNI